MVWFLRIILGFLIVILFSVAFLGAFGKAIDADHAVRDGLIIGFISALAWGLSVLGAEGWNGFFNLFAGLFAAVSLGYLTAIKDVCPQETSFTFICSASAWIAGLLK
jgi:hypothetical protein